MNLVGVAEKLAGFVKSLQVIAYGVCTPYHRYAQSRDVADEVRQRQPGELGGAAQRQAPVLVERQRQANAWCAGSPTFRTFVRQAAMSRRIACSAGVRIPSERCGLRLLQ